MEIVAIPAFEDNYIWSITQPGSQKCIIVDPGDADVVADFLEAHQYQLDTILITHHHPDHTGALKALMSAYQPAVFAPPHPSLPKKINLLYDGQTINIDALSLQLSVIATPGHTLDHICYFSIQHKILFSGDTLFAGGCGRLFEGTPQQMYQSLSKLTVLPPQTQIYCAHEYTETNLRFALEMEPSNMLLQKRLNQVIAKRDNNEITLPSTLLEELQTNPFLRCDQVDFREQLEKQLNQKCFSAIKAFELLRAHKDHWRG